MKSGAFPRNSSVIASPEQFVTIELHNHQMKKKYRHHRESIINEIKVTEDLVEETLNKHMRHPKSTFNPKLKKEHNMCMTVRQLREKQTFKHEQTYVMSHQVKRKLQQLGNISHHFEKACIPKKKSIKLIEMNDQSYSLPIVFADEPAVVPTKRSKDELREQKLLLSEWKDKVRLGRQYITHQKDRYPARFKLKDLKYCIEQEKENANNLTFKQNMKSLRDVYYSDMKQQRKTAPVPSNSLEFLFCESKEKKASLGYNGSIQVQPARQLQEFIEGGEMKSTNQYTQHINIPEFMRSKDKFKTLSKIYNHVKEGTANEMKDYSIDSFDTPSILSVVYYSQNGNNMTELQKKLIKKKLHFVD